MESEKKYHFANDSEPRHGGMGLVRKAVRASDLMQVAVKYITPEILAKQPAAKLAFEREISIVSKLAHKNVIKILDYGYEREESSFYIEMPWYELSLEDVFYQEPFKDWEDYWYRIGEAMLSGLYHTHINGVAHRDLKPQNILIDERGRPVIADFGISKFRRDGEKSKTQKFMGSEPYTPKEIEPTEYCKSRDVYSFGVVSISCMLNKRLESYEQLAREWQNIAAPEWVRSILSKCVEEDWRDRYATCVDVYDQFKNNLSEPNERSQKIRISQVAAKVKSDLDRYGLCKINEAEEYICDELNGDSVVKSHPSAEIDHVIFYVNGMTLHAKIDEKAKDSLCILGMKKISPDYAEILRDESFLFPFLFEIPSRKGDVSAALLVKYLSEVRSGLNENSQSRSLFSKWSLILSLKDQVIRNSCPDIRYRSKMHRSGKMVISVLGEAPDTAEGQSYFIEDDDKRFEVEIERVSGKTVEVTIRKGEQDLFPDRGILKFDVKAHAASIKRQEAALSDFASRRVVNERLSDILQSPEKSRSSSAHTESFISSFDASKKSAHVKFLNADDIFLLVGPPGTGKTFFIADLMASEISRNPETKILLAGQTHNAVDNAIESFVSNTGNESIIRVGASRGEKISDKAKHYLIEKVSKRWADEVSKKSLDALAEIVTEWGLDAEVVKAIVLSGRIRNIEKEREEAKAAIRSVKEHLNILDGRAGEKASGQAETVANILSEIDDLKDELAELQDAVSEANVDIDDLLKELAKCGRDGQEVHQFKDEELDEWYSDIMSHENGPASAKLIEVVNEWVLRLKSPSDLHPAVISDASVVAGTCIGFSMNRAAINEVYDLVIIDEASKVTPTELLVPMSRAKKVVLVGDSNQLPPFIENELCDEKLLRDNDLIEADIKKTLFSYLEEMLPDSSKSSLLIQYRMRHEVSGLISDIFYGGELESSTRNSSGRKLPSMGSPVVFVDYSSSGPEFEKREGLKIKNDKECELILRDLKLLQILSKGFSLDVAVIAAYAAQRNLIASRLQALKGSLSNLNVSVETIHSYQGRECDVVFVSFVRSNARRDIGFLRERPIINVALSRAREQLRIYCSADTFVRSRTPNAISEIYEYIRKSESCEVVHGS